MKRKFRLHDVLLLTALLICAYKFSFISSDINRENLSSASASDSTGFTNYILGAAWLDSTPVSYWNINNHLDSYKELNFNASHMYGKDSDSLGNFYQDTLTVDQKNTINRLVSESNQLGMSSNFERVRISNLCYSQRLIYEAEGGNNGFSYQRRTADIVPDSGRQVIHACTNSVECPVTDVSPRMLCDSIYENLQHTDLYYFPPGSTDNLIWKIKPVMKIDSNDFIPGDATPVVAIITKNYIGNDIDTIIIKVKNFGLNSYSGNYIQDYFDLDHPLEVNGHIDSINSLSYGRPAPGTGIEDCKVDFQVYWYGLVDVWFDKMIVDDERADELFKGIHDIKIQDEISTLNNSIVFTMDELVTSQAYTTKYVIDKMKSYNPNEKIQFALSNNLNQYSHRNKSLGSKVLLDISRPDIISIDAHPFPLEAGTGGYIPENLSAMDSFDLRIPNIWKKQIRNIIHFCRNIHLEV